MNNQDNPFCDEPVNGDEPDVNKMRELAQHLSVILPKLYEQYNLLKDLEYRTSEEEQLLLRMKESFTEILPYVAHLKDFFGERAYKQATAFYYHVKELAAEGNAEAQEILNHLKPLYEQSLKDNLGAN